MFERLMFHYKDKSIFWLALWLMCFLALPLSVHAQESDADIGVSVAEISLENKLLTLLETIEEKQRSITSTKLRIKKETDSDELKKLQQQILNDQDIIQGMREQFVSLSAGGEKVFVERKLTQKKINLQEDIEAIFSPLIEQLKNISERPKRIEELEQDIIYWSSRREELNRAVNYTETTKNVVANKLVIKEVNTLLEDAKKQYETAGQKLEILQAELENIRGDKNPLWENVFSLANSFITSMLYYFLLALFFAVIAYQCVSLIARLPKLLIDKRQPKRYVFVARTINLSKGILGIIAAVAVYLMVLYASGQWILLVLSLFVFAGSVLTLRNFVPRYFTEIRTLLNLGSIRQDERIVFNDLIWRINLIDVHTHLHNPALDAHLRVPIGKLVDFSSRPYHKDEPWFPTQPKDIVLLEDGVFGEIKHQSIDVVEVDFGGSIYTYPTKQFLSKRPRNLSEGFTVYEIFGFDYQHQNESTTSMLEKYTVWIENVIKNSMVAEYCIGLSVEFDKAASSSLDFKVIAAFSGEAANQYFRISRIIQKASVDIANQEGWVIPFQQITIHNANE